jgi:proline iminopeptidase
MPIFEKSILPHEKFYICKFTKNIDAPYLVFIHGGPGLNCGTLDYLIEFSNFFNALNCNLVLYDQRGCGKSIKFFDSNIYVSHNDNVKDFEEIYNFLLSEVKLKIYGFIGHSYGSKLLADFYKSTNSKLPGIFLATANSLLTPRLNNLMSDLNYLKKSDPDKYAEAMSKSTHTIDLKIIWQLTEELAPHFQENKDRYLLYWSNLSIFEMIQKIQKEINLPINQNVFMSVRKDLYSDENNFLVDIESLNIKKLWINGFQDSIMGEPMFGLANRGKVTLFAKSAHYPHIEENEHFCEVINEFTKTH